MYLSDLVLPLPQASELRGTLHGLRKAQTHTVLDLLLKRGH